MGYGTGIMFRVTLVSNGDSAMVGLEGPLRSAGLEVVHVTTFPEEAEPDPAAAPDVLVIDLRGTGKPQRTLFHDAWESAYALGILTPQQVEEVDPSAGLDDFIATPIQFPELIARVQQILWRHGQSAGRNVISAGDLVMDLSNYQIFESGKPLTLTYKEYELLRFLMTHTGQVFSREQLLNRVWGYQYYGGSRTVDVHVRRLRSKLSDISGDYIETVRNVGYRFSEPLR